MKTTFLVLVISITSLVFLNSGCSGKGGEGSFGSINLPNVAPPQNPTDPGPTPPTGDPVLNTNAFYVGLQPGDGMIAHMSKTSGFSDACAIPKSATSSQDIMCFIDAPEGELYGKTLNMLFNVPAGDMCRYLVRQPYWYFNRETGLGPVSVDITVAQSTDPTATAYNCDITYEDGTTFSYSTSSDCSSADREARIAFSESDVPAVSCVYGDCCTGAYQYDLRITDPSGDVTTSIVNSTVKWNNDPTSLRKCLGGPGRTNWSSFDAETGYPKWLQSYSGAGLNEVYSVSSIIELGIQTQNASYPLTTRNTANFYTPTLHTHTGFVSAVSSSVPFYVNPIDDRSGTIINTSKFFIDGQPAYDFICMDAGYELKHRIRVYVREWDTYEEYTKYITTAGNDGSPSSPGNDGTDCAGMDGFYNDCNDLLSNDDYLTLDLGLPNWDTSAPLNDRRLYFPRDIYPN